MTLLIWSFYYQVCDEFVYAAMVTIVLQCNPEIRQHSNHSDIVFLKKTT